MPIVHHHPPKKCYHNLCSCFMLIYCHLHERQSCTDRKRDPLSSGYTTQVWQSGLSHTEAQSLKLDLSLLHRWVASQHAWTQIKISSGVAGTWITTPTWDAEELYGILTQQHPPHDFCSGPICFYFPEVCFCYYFHPLVAIALIMHYLQDCASKVIFKLLLNAFDIMLEYLFLCQKNENRVVFS